MKRTRQEIGKGRKPKRGSRKEGLVSKCSKERAGEMEGKKTTGGEKGGPNVQEKIKPRPETACTSSGKER